MDDVLHVDTVDDTVRVELDGETPNLSIAEQLFRGLDAAIQALRSDQNADPDDVDDDYGLDGDYDLDEEYVEVRTSVKGLGPARAAVRVAGGRCRYERRGTGAGEGSGSRDSESAS